MSNLSVHDNVAVCGWVRVSINVENLKFGSEVDVNAECNLLIILITKTPLWQRLKNDYSIKKEEIHLVCKSLSSNKTCTTANIIYEYFKESININCRSLKLIFNYILIAGEVP